jgi:hypothetical protein
MNRSDSSGVVATLSAGEPVDILDPLPAPSSLDEWVKVRSQGQPAGYARLAVFDLVQSGDHPFDLWHALALIQSTSDP